MGRLARTVLGVAGATLFAGLAGIAQGAIPPDEEGPRVTFTTRKGAVRAGVPHEVDVHATRPVTHVTGLAGDQASGVTGVEVFFCQGYRLAGGGWVCTGPFFERAKVSISCDRTGRSCAWAAWVPVRPARYLAFASAYDGAGNEGWTPNPLHVTVL